MGGLLALAGCFEPALAAWRACDPARSRDPTIGVTLCVGAGALQLDTRPRPDAALDTALLDDALRLARRCLVVLLAVLVLAELSAWLL
jgi:membrane protein required for beta-lactamase induction